MIRRPQAYRCSASSCPHAVLAVYFFFLFNRFKHERSACRFWSRRQTSMFIFICATRCAQQRVVSSPLVPIFRTCLTPRSLSPCLLLFRQPSLSAFSRWERKKWPAAIRGEKCQLHAHLHMRTHARATCRKRMLACSLPGIQLTAVVRRKKNCHAGFSILDSSG